MRQKLKLILEKAESTKGVRLIPERLYFEMQTTLNELVEAADDNKGQNQSTTPSVKQ